jgi:hypothetical protein
VWFTVLPVTVPLAPDLVAAPAWGAGRGVLCCVRPGCARLATTTLRFDYAARTVMLDPVDAQHGPGAYDLCFQHAARSGPPAGWTMRDRAPSRDGAAEPPPPVGPSRDRGVDRLAAALSAVPRVVSEDAPDAAPVRPDRPVGALPATPVARDSAAPGAPDAQGAVSTAGPLGQLLGGGAQQAPPAPLTPHEQRSARAASAVASTDVEVARSLRLVADPVGAVWCADLLPPRASAPAGS